MTDYLAEGLQRGSHMRQKTREREEWHSTEINPPADGFLSGMTSMGPWLCLNRAGSLTATNTLYTVHFRARLRLHERAAWALALLSSTAAAQHAAVGRNYSKGLLKFEPRDVMALLVPSPVDVTARAVEVYHRVVDDLLAGKADRARAAAEAYVRGRTA